LQCGIACPLRMILVCDRRPEQSHDPVAGVLVDRPLEAVNALGEDREEAIHDPVPLFGIHLLAEIHRALHVGEEYGDLFALAFEGATRGEDLLGQMVRRVRAGVALCCRLASLEPLYDRRSALVTELCRGEKFRPAGVFVLSSASVTRSLSSPWLRPPDRAVIF
jgi:hypothetical protein